MDWVNYIGRFTKQSGIVAKVLQLFKLCSLSQNTFDYKIGIRAESPNGVVDTNVVEYVVTLDG